MPSKKSIYKKPYEKVDSVDESVWFSNDTPIMETDFTFVFDDRYPCVEGHKLFIPKENNAHFLGRSYGLAYDYGNQQIKKGKLLAGSYVAKARTASPKTMKRAGSHQTKFLRVSKQHLKQWYQRRNTSLQADKKSLSQQDVMSRSGGDLSDFSTDRGIGGGSGNEHA